MLPWVGLSHNNLSFIVVTKGHLGIAITILLCSSEISVIYKPLFKWKIGEISGEARGSEKAKDNTARHQVVRNKQGSLEKKSVT